MPLFDRLETECADMEVCRTSLTTLVPSNWDRAIFVLAGQSQNRVRSESGVRNLVVSEVDAKVVFFDHGRVVGTETVYSFPDKPGGWAFVDSSYTKRRGWYAVQSDLSEVDAIRTFRFGSPIWILFPQDFCEQSD